MYKSNEFEYDLWTAEENGIKRCYARLKATGEVCEIAPEVMRCLRAEEKRLYREKEKRAKLGAPLSLEAVAEEGLESWFEDGGAGVSEMETRVEEEEFRKLLTPKQRAVYDACMRGGVSVRAYAKERGLSPKTVSGTVAAIREKFRKYSGDTPTNG